MISDEYMRLQAFPGVCRPLCSREHWRWAGEACMGE